MMVSVGTRVQRFLLSDVAAVAGMPVATLRSLVQRKHIWFDDDEDVVSSDARVPYQIGIRSAIRVAMMALLTQRDGMHPRRAWMITAGFTEFGDGPLPNQPARAPGELFERGRTWLIARDGSDTSEVINVRPDTRAVELMQGLDGRAVSFIAIDCNELVDRVSRALAPK
jgi:hypothetical protein